MSSIKTFNVFLAVVALLCAILTVVLLAYAICTGDVFGTISMSVMTVYSGWVFSTFPNMEAFYYVR